jgi:thioredoxin-dependent peroxiredoxin
MQSTSEAGEQLPIIDVGDTLPTLILKNEKNEDIQIADIASERGVVLFLVPKVDTRKDMPPRFSSPEVSC